MDNIKNLISQSNKLSANSDKYLLEAYKLLHGLISKRNINESIESATEMCVILAESCNKNNQKSEANDCVKLFFSLDPPENQYLARAYIVQAQLIQPARFDDINTLEKPIGFILKAINFSKKEKQFHYLVYNSSLVYYEIVRNFLRPNNYVYLCSSMTQVSKALEEINDSNMEWRSQIMLLLLQCHIDAGHRKEITQIVDGTATFIGKHASYLLKDLLTLLINNGVGTMEKYLWYTKNSPPMQVYIKICRLKIMKEKDLENSYVIEARKILLGLIGVEDTSGNTESEELQAKFDPKRRTSTLFNSKKLTSEQRCSLLLELAKVCMQRSILDSCRQCVDKAKQMCSEEMSDILQEAEFINSELTMMESELTSDKITANSLKLRLTTIEKCRSTLLSASRSGNNRLIEFGCVTLWNLCLPILQPNLREKISSSLILIANSLENIGCLNYKFSCQVHMEVGKYFAASEQANDAIIYFKKAQLLDKTGEYMEMMDHYINKLKLQEKLYEKPTEPCDLARQLIEQVQSTLKITKIPLPQLRPLLAQIGHCLAPDDFLVLLDHDMSVEEMSNDDPIHSKATKTVAWENMIERLNSYLKRSGNANDRIKMTLWADLVKLARTTQLWDICRVASCFAVLYDDGRWKNNFQMKLESLSRKGNRGTLLNQNQPIDTNNSAPVEAINPEADVVDSVNGETKPRKKDDNDTTGYPVMTKSNRYDKLLVEMIADIYIIRAEAFMQAIRNEGAQLFTYPERPRDFKKHPKGYTKDTTKEDSEWDNYCKCLQRMSDLIVNCFLRSASLSAELQAPWVLQNAAIYLWNYSIHVTSLSEHFVLVPSFQAMFDMMRSMINEKMVHIITQYGVVLAHGLIQKMIPVTPIILENVFEIPHAGSAVDKKAKKGKESPKLKTTGPSAVQTQADSVAQYKKALDICQYLMDLTADVAPPVAMETIVSSQTNSSAASKTLPLGKPIDLSTKCRLIEMWVQCKQILQQPIGSTFGADDVDTKVGQRTHVRAITAVQMLWLSQNDLYRFADAPGVEECLQLIDLADWAQSEVVLQLLIKLCYVAMTLGGGNIVSVVNKVADAALKYRSMIEKKDGCLPLSYITFCQGISLHKNSTQHTSILIQCLKLLVKACCYAKEANNYFLVSQISHYFWNIAQIVIQRSSSSTPIAADIDTIISCIVATVDKRRVKLFFEPHTEEELPRIEFELQEKLPHYIQCQEDQKLITIDHCKSLFQSSYRRKMSKSSLEQDLVLRIQMYIAVFQSHFSQEKWSDALKVLDSAITELPRTNHRLELFRHRVLIKVRIGQSIELDIQKFKNQQEHEIALLWREVAIWSKTPDYQLKAYQKSIESLKLRESDWLKADLVKEMCQWMLHYNYPVDVCDQFIEWATDILLNIEFPKEKSSGNTSATKKKPSSVNSKKSKLKINVQIDEAVVNEEVVEHDWNVTVADKNEIEHGVTLQPGCPTTMAEINDIRQLSSLFINFVFRAQLIGSSDPRSKECIVMATACISRIWTVAMKGVSSIVKEISKTKSDSDSPSKGKDKKEKKEKNTKVEPEQNKSKVIKRKGPIDWIPGTFDEWALFEVSDDVLEALRSSSYMPRLGINGTSIKNMGDFVASCDALVGLLEDSGLELLAFPVLSLLDVVSRSSEIVPAIVMNQYVHLRSLRIALRLNMSAASAHHEKFIESPNIPPESVSYAALLEMTAKEYKEIHALPGKSTKFPLNFDSSPKTYLTIPHLMRKYTAHGYIHETWIRIAEILIDLGYNKEASEVLTQAKTISDTLEDNDKLTDIDILTTQLHVREGEIDNALLVLDALEERFSQFSLKQWREFIHLLFEISGSVCYRTKEVERCKIRLVRLKEHTAKRLSTLCLNNQRPEIDVMMTDLDFNIVVMDYRLLELELRNSENCETNRIEINRRLLSFIEHLDQITASYKTLVHISGLANVLETKVRMYDTIITLSDRENSKMVMLKKLRTLEELHWIQMVKYDDCHSTCMEAQGHTYNLPVDRTLAVASLSLVDCLMEIYRINVENKVTLNLEHRRKNLLKQIVDEYVADSIPNDEVPDWGEALIGISDRIVSILSDCIAQCHNIPDINAKALSRYGHVLKLRAMEIHPNDDDQWCFNSNMVTEAIRSNNDDIEAMPTVAEDDDERVNELSPLEYRQKIIETQTSMNLAQSQEYLSQATELLTQAINVSINCQNYGVTVYAVELLMDMVGQFEANTSSQLLCLHQSCVASIQMRDRLRNTLRQASMGQLAGLVLQYNYMVDSSLSRQSNLTSSSLYRAVVYKLNNNFTAWRTTNVTLSQSDMLKDLSGICNGFCVIQHSTDLSHVYAAFIDGKQKSVAVTKQGNKPMSGRGAIYRMKTTAQYTRELVKTWTTFKHHMDDIVYDIENKRSINDQKTELYHQIDNRDEIERAIDEKLELETVINQKISELEDEFSAISDQLQDYLAPLLESLSPLLPSNVTRHSSSHPKSANQQSVSKDTLIILIDDILSCTALECLPYLKCPMSRDFSLQILHHRFKGFDKADAAGNDPQQAVDSGKKKDKTKTPHRISALRDGNKKTTKIVPLNRQIPTGALSLDTHQIRYIVDPNLDTATMKEQSLGAIFKKEMTLNTIREQQVTPRWIGLIGEECRPSVEEIELYMKDALSVLYLNTENIVSLLTPQRIAMLNTNELQLICCIDRIRNRIFKDRMLRKVNSCSYIDLEYEDSVNTARLLTLAGAKSILSNQYSGLLNWTSMEIRQLFSHFMDTGVSLSEGLYASRLPNTNKDLPQIDDLAANQNEDLDKNLRMVMYNPVIYGLPNFILNGS